MVILLFVLYKSNTMREFEGIVFDIDNTAVSEGSMHVASKALLRAFHSLNSGVVAIAATGRSLEFALPITSALQLRHESIVANGAQIINSMTGDVINQNNLSKRQVSKIIKMCSEFDKLAHCCIAGDPVDSKYTALEQVAREAPGLFFMGLDKITAESFNKRLINSEHVSSYISSSFENGRWTYDVNIGSAEAEKGIALIKLLGRKSIDPMNMIAVGDGINDVSLFQSVGYRIAMADAHHDLLSIADEIIPSQKEDGLLRVIERFL